MPNPHPSAARGAAFRWGLAVGGLLPTLAFGGILSFVQLRLPRFNFEVKASGLALTRHGATTMVLTDSRGWNLTQVCRGGCDDLSLGLRTEENGYEIKVIGKAGRTVAGGGTYVPAGAGWVERLSVEGDDRLEVMRSGGTKYR